MRNPLVKMMTVLIVAMTVVDSTLAQSTTAQQASRRPNIIVLLADDLGYGELGCQGNPQIPTPHIDSIAKNGVRFTSGYVTAAYCSASRAGLMTGRYQQTFGYEFNPIGHHNDDPNVGLPTSQVTLARHLHNVGYTTALIGKWHLGGTAKYHPIRHGFDEFFGFMHEGHYFVPPPYRGVTTMLRRRALPNVGPNVGPDTGPNGGKGRYISPDGKLIYSTQMGNDEPAYDANNPIIRGGQPVEEKAYLTDALTREAVDFIGRNKDRPFFLYLAYNAVHSPLQGADAYMKRFAHIKDVHRRIFAAMLSNLDDSVGDVLKKVRDEKLEGNTLIVFLSDNGGPTRELTSSNLPLRGGKGDLYEGGIRVPFMMQWKGTLPKSKVDDRPVISLDLFRTAATVASDKLPQKLWGDGVNLMPYLTGERKGNPHVALYWRSHNRAALRYGDWKIVRNPPRKQIKKPDWELYNLKDDMSEKKNIATLNPDRMKIMRELWWMHEGRLKDPFWWPNKK